MRFQKTTLFDFISIRSAIFLDENYLF